MARLWEKELPGFVTGAPMTYRYNGKQVIIVAVSTRGKPAELIALAVGDGVDDALSCVSSPMPPGASVSRVAAVRATREELAFGAHGLFARVRSLAMGRRAQAAQAHRLPARTMSPRSPASPARARVRCHPWQPNSSRTKSTPSPSWSLPGFPRQQGAPVEEDR